MSGQLYMDGTKLNRHLEEVVKWQRGERFAPIHMEVSLTNVCNQKCVFCYIDWQHGRNQMSEAMAVQLIRDAKRIGVKSALIAGEGEPTANKAYIRAIEVAGEVDFDVALNTNAVLLNPNDAARVLPHLSWMRVSFQAPTRDLYSKIHQCDPGHFDRVLNNLEACVKLKRDHGYRVTMGLQQVLVKENAHTVAEVAKLAKDIGFDYYVIKPCHPHELNQSGYVTVGDLVEQNRETLEKAQALSDDKFKAVVRWNFLHEAEVPRSYKKCLALPFIIQIGSGGQVYTCYPMSDRKEHLYGNLSEKSLEEIVFSPDFGKICQSVAETVDVSKCMPTCRQHNANKYLWWLTQETPSHLNFI